MGDLAADRAAAQVDSYIARFEATISAWNDLIRNTVPLTAAGYAWDQARPLETYNQPRQDVLVAWNRLKGIPEGLFSAGELAALKGGAWERAYNNVNGQYNSIYAPIAAGESAARDAAILKEQQTALLTRFAAALRAPFFEGNAAARSTLDSVKLILDEARTGYEFPVTQIQALEAEYNAYKGQFDSWRAAATQATEAAAAAADLRQKLEVQIQAAATQAAADAAAAEALRAELAAAGGVTQTQADRLSELQAAADRSAAEVSRLQTEVARLTPSVLTQGAETSVTTGASTAATAITASGSDSFHIGSLAIRKTHAYLLAGGAALLLMAGQDKKGRKT